MMDRKPVVLQTRILVISVILVVPAMIMAAGWFVVANREDLEHQAFQIVDGRTVTVGELFRFCDRYPQTDAGERLGVQAAICLGLSAHAKEFRQERPEQFPQALEIALGADETAFGAEAESRLRQAKRSLGDQSAESR